MTCTRRLPIPITNRQYGRRTVSAQSEDARTKVTEGGRGGRNDVHEPARGLRAAREEELGGRGRGQVEPLPDLDGVMGWHPLDERLSSRTNTLDEALTDLSISPYPCVLLALEGETEVYLRNSRLEGTRFLVRLAWHVLRPLA